MGVWTLAAVVLTAILTFAGCRSKDDPRGSQAPVYRDASYPVGYPQSGAPTRYEPGYRAGSGGTAPSRSGGSFWIGDRLEGSPSITIDLGEQRAYFYKGDRLAGVSRVSTGREGYRTSTGNFRITQKNADHRSNIYGDFVDDYGRVVVADVDVRSDEAPPGTRFRGAAMPHFMRFDGAIGMHGGYLPGYPASHGCVRLPETMARRFFANVSLGTPVTVVR